MAVWKLDRLGRSLKHLIEVVNALSEINIGFQSIQEKIDTTTSGGKLIFHIFASLAEFERDLIRERTNAGLRQVKLLYTLLTYIFKFYPCPNSAL